jgi:hypothetical protein
MEMLACSEGALVSKTGQGNAKSVNHATRDLVRCDSLRLKVITEEQ